MSECPEDCTSLKCPHLHFCVGPVCASKWQSAASFRARLLLPMCRECNDELYKTGGGQQCKVATCRSKWCRKLHACSKCEQWLSNASYRGWSIRPFSCSTCRLQKPTQACEPHPSIAGVMRVRLVGQHPKYALFDVEDLPLVQGHSWYLHKGAASAQIEGLKVFMHYLIAREIGRLQSISRFSCIHTDGNSLNNSRSNLATQKVRNARLQRSVKSRYTGVERYYKTSWRAYINLPQGNGTYCKKTLGVFDKSLDAAVCARVAYELKRPDTMPDYLIEEEDARALPNYEELKQGAIKALEGF